MADPALLETIIAKLEQADAILVYTGGAARRIAARALWLQIGETMLNLGDGGAATLQDCDGLSSQVRQLRNAIRKHLTAVHP